LPTAQEHDQPAQPPDRRELSCSSTTTMTSARSRAVSVTRVSGWEFVLGPLIGAGGVIAKPFGPLTLPGDVAGLVGDEPGAPPA
jgi:hypothetical protein